MKIFFLSIFLLSNLTAFIFQIEDDKQTSLTAEVLEIQKAGPSGTLIQYHNVKYRILNICDGEEKKPEIIVVYISVSTHELDDLKIGDVVCINVYKTHKFKKDAEELRKILREYGKDESELSDDKIPTYYGGDFIKNCQCYKK